MGPFDDSLFEARAQVREALSDLLARGLTHEISHVLKVRGTLLERAREATQSLVERNAMTLPAWQRYSGVVWSHLDPGTLHDSQRRRLLIPSGLYGLSCGTDAIADYRLTMKVSLGDLGPLGAFWRARLGRVLDEIPGATFVSLLPKEHAHALMSAGAYPSRTIVVSFVRHAGEGVVGHDAKAVKGVLARRILQDGIDAVPGFRWKGWRGVGDGEHLEVRAPRPAKKRG